MFKYSTFVFSCQLELTSIIKEMKFACTVFLVAFVSHCLADEPHCSKYDFEEKVLKKLIRMEFDAERMKSEVDESLKKSETLNSAVKGSINDFGVRIAETIKLVRENVSEALAALEEKFSALEQRNKNSLNEQQKKLDEIASGSKLNPTIAFTSRNPHKSKPQNGETIIFKTTLTNHGGGYDNTTGVFTAPADGVYLFTTQFCIHGDGRYMFTRIIRNGTSVKGSLIYDESSNFCTSSDAIIVMKALERVCVECGRTSSSSTVLYETSERWNTFSGALIH